MQTEKERDAAEEFEGATMRKAFLRALSAMMLGIVLPPFRWCRDVVHDALCRYQSRF